MVGTVCFRLRFRGTSHCLTTVFLSKSHYSNPHPYFIQVIGKPGVASPILCQSRNRSCQVGVNSELQEASQLSSLKPSLSHCDTCTEKGLDLELSCATIWHGLLPSRNLFVVRQSQSRKSNFSTHRPTSSSSRSLCSSSRRSVWPESGSSGSEAVSKSAFEASHRSNLSNGGRSTRDAMASCLLDGSWNVAWDTRPARWLHGPNSAWLLFGVRSCVSVVPENPSNSKIPSSPILCLNEKLKGQSHATMDKASDFQVVLAQNPANKTRASVVYRIIGMPSDGRCLFRAIAYGASLRCGSPLLGEEVQQELAADDLRNKVVDELVSRRSETEWFIEDDFDTYVKRMREPYIWGGEPELLMASHVLKMPITVHLLDKTTEQITSVAEYGKEYGVENPIRVLYHGFGHYDALQIEKNSEIDSST